MSNPSSCGNAQCPPSSKPSGSSKAAFASRTAAGRYRRLTGVSRSHLSRIFLLDHRHFDLRLYAGPAPDRSGPQAGRRRSRYSFGGARCRLRLPRGIHPRLPRPVRHDARRGPRRRSLDNSSSWSPSMNDRHRHHHPRPAPLRRSPALASSPASSQRHEMTNRRRHSGPMAAFQPYIGNIPGQCRQAAYGICRRGVRGPGRIRLSLSPSKCAKAPKCRPNSKCITIPAQPTPASPIRATSPPSAPLSRPSSDWLPKSGLRSGRGL